jgi:hypothetical protein
MILKKFNNEKCIFEVITIKEVKKIPLKKYISNQAEFSFYRMNAQSADIYAFSYDKIGQKYLDGTTCKKIDYSGGWDWSNSLVDDSAEYIYNLQEKKFYKIINQ